MSEQAATRPDSYRNHSNHEQVNVGEIRRCQATQSRGGARGNYRAAHRTQRGLGGMGGRRNLKWGLQPARQVFVPGFVSVQVDVYAKALQPQDHGAAPYDMETGAELGVARGTQWWYLGAPLQCKVVNGSKASLTLKRGEKVAESTQSTRATENVSRFCGTLPY